MNALVAIGLDYRISRALCTVALVPLNFTRDAPLGLPPACAPSGYGVVMPIVVPS